MFKNIVIWILMVLYLYTLTFDLFLNQNIRIPSPLLFGYPLILLFGKLKGTPFLYGKEFLFFFLACFFYYLIGQSNMKFFAVYMLVIITCGLYFNYFVGTNTARFNHSIFIFAGLLFVSAVILLLNHMNPAQINTLRSKLIGSPIEQSPSGIAAAIFTFGYQIAAFTSFIFIYSLKFRWNILLKIVVFALCLVFLFYGMQRSALVAFFASLILFLIFYYKVKAVFLFGILTVAIVFLINLINFKDLTSSQYDNVFAKNERNEQKGEDRENLVTENLKIYSQYPYGLIFYGKNWSEVTHNNLVYRGGLTSHNAYLMFLTYLGPFLGLTILIAIYRPILKMFKNVMSGIRKRENALVICLCFAFISASLNSLFHNAWLVAANGPTLFLYFSILHFGRMKQAELKKAKNVEELSDASV